MKQYVVPDPRPTAAICPLCECTFGTTPLSYPWPHRCPFCNQLSLIRDAWHIPTAMAMGEKQRVAIERLEDAQDKEMKYFNVLVEEDLTKLKDKQNKDRDILTTSHKDAMTNLLATFTGE